MAPINDPNREVDVICQFTSEGGIIPIRIRVADEDGQYQTFNIKGYKENGHLQGIRSYLCKIQVLGTTRYVTLILSVADFTWHMRVGE